MLKQWQFTKRKHNSLSRKRGSFGYSQLTYMIPDQVDPLSFLTEKALGFAKRYLKKNEPFTYKELPNLKVRGDDINLQVRIKDLSVASGAAFRTDDIITDPERMSIRFRIIFPQIIIAGRYSVSGKEEGKKVSSKGQFRIGLYNSKVTGRLSLLIIEGKIYIKRFDMDYFINNNLKVEQISIDSKGMTEDDLFELLPHVVFLYLEENEKLICFIISIQLTEYANVRLAKLSVKNAVKWLTEDV